MSPGNLRRLPQSLLSVSSAWRDAGVEHCRTGRMATHGTSLGAGWREKRLLASRKDTLAWHSITLALAAKAWRHHRGTQSYKQIPDEWGRQRIRR